MMQIVPHNASSCLEKLLGILSLLGRKCGYVMLLAAVINVASKLQILLGIVAR